ncbi:hypothetical protein [Serratia marcescens]|uniref:hypothetical protein n=1 Tax=Serratia marcescens TaxID=615 RepID=UPI001364D7EB|nr:hypothetical protein [Serratia marcescens]
MIEMTGHKAVENKNVTWQDNARSPDVLYVGTQPAIAVFAEIESDSLPKKRRIS